MANLTAQLSSRDESLREVFDRRMRVATSRTDDGLY